jgi:endonuclease-8
VEGPPLKVIAEELSFVAGETINSAFGSAKIEKEVLIGKRVERVFSRGKNLLIQFPEYTVRVHFVMYGSYAVNKPRKNVAPSLSLTTQDSVLDFYRCSIRMSRNEEVDRLFDEEVDIMSEKWNAMKVLELTLNEVDELVCDVLLDQSIFAGVGNIIKNEALFAARVHPLSKVGKIPKEKLEEIVRETRNFSKLLYETRKQGLNLKEYLKIYQKQDCSGSGEKVTRAITGKRKRLSHFCPSLQVRYV